MANKDRLRAKPIEIKGRIPSLHESVDNAVNGTQQPEIVEREIIVQDPNAIVPQQTGEMVYKRFSVSPVGVSIPDDITEAELVDLRDTFQRLNTSIQWLVGDLANSLKTFKGDGVYDDLAVKFDKSPKTVREWAYVCASVHLSIRMDKPLTFKHHQAVAALDSEAQRYWLQYAFQNGSSVEDLKEQIRIWKNEPLEATPTPPTFAERLQRDFRRELKALKGDRAGRAQLRAILEDLISQIEQMG